MNEELEFKDGDRVILNDNYFVNYKANREDKIGTVKVSKRKNRRKAVRVVWDNAITASYFHKDLLMKLII